MRPRLALAASISLAWLMLVNGCKSTTPEQLATWQQSATVLREEVQALRVELPAIQDPAQRAALEAKIAVMERVAQRFEDAIHDAASAADAPWALGETALAVAGGFFPPLLALLPIVRTLRRQRESIFASVTAGGGVVNPEAARDSLSDDAAAYAAFKAYKKANGVTP